VDPTSLVEVVKEVGKLVRSSPSCSDPTALVAVVKEVAEMRRQNAA
jgi:hypothetical protein